MKHTLTLVLILTALSVNAQVDSEKYGKEWGERVMRGRRLKAEPTYDGSPFVGNKIKELPKFPTQEEMLLAAEERKRNRPIYIKPPEYPEITWTAADHIYEIKQPVTKTITIISPETGIHDFYIEIR